MSAPLGRLRLPWVDLPLFGLLLACAPVCALPDLPEQVGLGPGGASLLERAALPQVLGLAQVQRLVTGRLGSVHVLRRVLRRPFTLFGHAQCEGLHLFGAWLLALGPLGLFEPPLQFVHEVGAMAESAAGFEGGDERAKERIARLVQLGSLVEAMCSTDVMDNYTSREDLKTTVTKALEHNVRTSDGMNWNLHDLVYEALSEEWGRRDGEISDLWADDGPSGYQPPSYEPVNPERRTPQTPSDGLI